MQYMLRGEELVSGRHRRQDLAKGTKGRRLIAVGDEAVGSGRVRGLAQVEGTNYS